MEGRPIDTIGYRGNAKNIITVGATWAIEQANDDPNSDINSLAEVSAHGPALDGRTLPLSEVAEAVYTEGPMQISREDARRRITIGINVRNRDIASLVEFARFDRSAMFPGTHRTRQCLTTREQTNAT